MARLQPGVNDLGTVRPDLAAQLVHPSQAKEVTEFSDKILSWFCETNHPRYEWEAKVANRSSGFGCGACSGKVVIPGWNDLATVNPGLAAQLVEPSQAETVTAGSNKKLLWFCETNHPRHEWEAIVNGRSQGKGCGACDGKVVITGWNDLATVNPGLAAQLVEPSQAETVTKSSSKKLLWFCETNHPRHEWEAAVRSRSNGFGCGACSGKVVIPGWNDLGTVLPDLADQLVYPSDAKTVTKSSSKKLLWFCETGHQRYEWETDVNSRSKGTGCPTCAESGYDSSKPGSFYRFEFVHNGVTFLCYGISNVIEKRRKTYERELDIQNFQFVYFEDGSIPQQIEKKFHEIRKQSSAPASTCGVDGTITESFPISDIELSTFFVAHWASAVATSKTADAFLPAWGAQASDLLTSVR